MIHIVKKAALCSIQLVKSKPMKPQLLLRTEGSSDIWVAGCTRPSVLEKDVAARNASALPVAPRLAVVFERHNLWKSLSVVLKCNSSRPGWHKSSQRAGELARRVCSDWQ